MPLRWKEIWLCHSIRSLIAAQRSAQVRPLSAEPFCTSRTLALPSIYILIRGSQLLQLGQESLRVGSNHLIGLLALPEDQEGRHRADPQVLRQLWQLVDVELDKVDLFVLQVGFLVGVPAPRVVSSAHRALYY